MVIEGSLIGYRERTVTGPAVDSDFSLWSALWTPTPGHRRNP